MSSKKEDFGKLYLPLKAMVIFKRKGEDSDYYVESYDMDKNGLPTNGHPLSLRESNAFAKALTTTSKRSQGFLVPAGLLPKNVLYINNGNKDGYAIWQTPAHKKELRFLPSLGIPSGEAEMPALLWKATRTSLQIFALRQDGADLDTVLCKAPFFNIYLDGKVCMGNVPIRIPAECGLERFISLWQNYFFDSYFSHTIHGESPVRGNIVQLWQGLLATGEPFPTDQLLNTRYQIKHLLP